MAFSLLPLVVLVLSPHLPCTSEALVQTPTGPTVNIEVHPATSTTETPSTSTPSTTAVTAQRRQVVEGTVDVVPYIPTRQQQLQPSSFTSAGHQAVSSPVVSGLPLTQHIIGRAQPRWTVPAYNAPLWPSHPAQRRTHALKNRFPFTVPHPVHHPYRRPPYTSHRRTQFESQKFNGGPRPYLSVPKPPSPPIRQHAPEQVIYSKPPPEVIYYGPQPPPLDYEQPKYRTRPRPGRPEVAPVEYAPSHEHPSSISSDDSDIINDLDMYIPDDEPAASGSSVSSSYGNGGYISSGGGSGGGMASMMMPLMMLGLTIPALGLVFTYLSRRRRRRRRRDLSSNSADQLDRYTNLLLDGIDKVGKKQA